MAFFKIVIRDKRTQVVYMMISDITGKPVKNRRQLEQ